MPENTTSDNALTDPDLDSPNTDPGDPAALGDKGSLTALRT